MFSSTEILGRIVDVCQFFLYFAANCSHDAIGSLQLAKYQSRDPLKGCDWLKTDHVIRLTVFDWLQVEVNGGVCGNAIIEEGETCDCGSVDDCPILDPCCEVGTCQLKNTSSCFTGACCTAEVSSHVMINQFYLDVILYLQEFLQTTMS